MPSNWLNDLAILTIFETILLEALPYATSPVFCPNCLIVVNSLLPFIYCNDFVIALILEPILLLSGIFNFPKVFSFLEILTIELTVDTASPNELDLSLELIHEPKFAPWIVSITSTTLRTFALADSNVLAFIFPNLLIFNPASATESTALPTFCIVVALLPWNELLVAISMIVSQTIFKLFSFSDKPLLFLGTSLSSFPIALDSVYKAPASPTNVATPEPATNAPTPVRPVKAPNPPTHKDMEAITLCNEPIFFSNFETLSGIALSSSPIPFA